MIQPGTEIEVMYGNDAITRRPVPFDKPDKYLRAIQKANPISYKYVQTSTFHPLVRIEGIQRRVIVYPSNSGFTFGYTRDGVREKFVAFPRSLPFAEILSMQWKFSGVIPLNQEGLQMPKGRPFDIARTLFELWYREFHAQVAANSQVRLTQDAINRSFGKRGKGFFVASYLELGKFSHSIPINKYSTQAGQWALKKIYEYQVGLSKFGKDPSISDWYKDGSVLQMIDTTIDHYHKALEMEEYFNTSSVWGNQAQGNLTVIAQPAAQEQPKEVMPIEKLHAKERERIATAKKIIELAGTYDIGVACGMSGIDDSTFRKWRKKYGDYL